LFNNISTVYLFLILIKEILFSMRIKKIVSLNFNKAKKRYVKYIIIHYTGMKNQKIAIQKLQSRVAKVSTHYLISKKGTIYQMVEDKNVAWHAGKSKYGTDVNLNSKSIGIELVNNGKEKFTLKQIKNLCNLIKSMKNKHKIDKKYVLGHEHIAPGRKFDPGKLFPWSYLAKRNLSKIY
jgi:N-acetylmuramoyl-L-alanine amidase